jgi:hypothetical protein
MEPLMDTNRLIVLAKVLMLTFGISLAASASPLAGDTAKGKKLHQTNCTGCHDDKVYRRTDRRITTFEALQGQINACGHQVKKDFSRENIDDMVKYLNDTYYKFK